MRIDTVNRSSTLSKGSAVSRAGGGVDFVPAGGAAPARVAGQMPVQAMAGIEAILALQAVDDATTARRKAVRRGRTLLDLLDDMRADLLLGRVSGERLDGMVAILAEARERSLPELDGLLDDIELRVRVELAKAGRFPVL
ncbi:MAG: hypothetical protein ABS76_02510 [Pelagibacterium sp. SCN 64-44]|nr:MAG: hypothetical protein ABS76_02510 [Pelagibacterium sp. SCN 64-44]